MVEIRRRRRDVALVSAAPLFEIKFGDDYTFARWAADNRNRDRLRLLQSVRNRAPFQDVGPIDGEGITSYLLDGTLADGLGYAHAFDGLALSMNTDDRWDCAQITLVRQELVEDDYSNLALAESSVAVRHAARPEHADAHGAWLSGAGVQELRTAGHLWEKKADFFPHLAFLPRVKNDLFTLNPLQLKEVAARLVEMEQAVAKWNPAVAAAPDWMSKVTPEAEQRKLLCVFKDFDGVARTFDLHARFTPGEGRIHFRLDRAEPGVVIAYVGRKIQRRA